MSDAPSASVLFAVGRLVGFALTAGLAVGLVGAVVLLPAYARVAQARYEQGVQEAQTADLNGLVEAQARMIRDLPRDAVLTSRLKMSQEAAKPDSGAVVYSLPTVGPGKPPDLVWVDRAPRPDPPPAWLVHVAGRFRRTETRRGLLLVACGALVVAMFLFSAPDKYRRRDEEEEEEEEA